MEIKKEFTGVWIPRSIWENEELGWTEKMLLVEIKSLDNADGCYAGNEHFAKFFKLSKDRISKMVTELRRLDYIDVQLLYKEGTKQIERRIIRVNLNKYEGKGNNTDRYGRKQLDPIGENDDTPIGENAVDNNTLINNTININNKTLVQDELERDFQDFYSNYPIKKGKANAVKAYKKARKNKNTHEQIMNGLFNYKRELDLKGTDKQFIKQPATFLNGEHFNDEYDLVPVMQNGKQLKPWEEVVYEPTTSWNDNVNDRGSISKPIPHKQLGINF